MGTAIKADRDAYNQKANPTWIDYTGNWMIVRGDPTLTYRAFVGFDISGITIANVTKAIMYLYITNAGGTSQTINAKRTTSAWTENDPYWNNMPTTTTTNQVSVAMDTGINKWYAFDVTDALKDETTSIFGMQLKDSVETADKENTFHTEDYISGAYAPHLFIIQSTDDEDELNPEKDVYVTTGSPTVAFGTQNTISVEWTSASAQQNGYIEYDVSGVTIDSNTSATLNLEYTGHTDNVTFRIHRTTSAISETSTTWNNQPTYDSGTYVDFTTPTGFIFSQEIDISSLIQNETGSTFGLRISAIDTSTYKTLTLRSRESVGPYNTITILQDRYVRATGGSDSNNGRTWATAWATINKAATTVLDGTTVHIGFGTYSSEPVSNKIAPDNAGSEGIKYLPETAVTGGGTGSVIIEVN